MENSRDTLVKEFDHRLNTPLSDGGYKLKGTHFRLGKGLHAGVYYHLKKFYEIETNCDLVAQILCSEIQLSADTTLVSSGAHTNLLLNRTAALLRKRFPNFKINYTIAYHNKGENFRFQFEDNFHQNLLIVLPAVNTLGRYVIFKKSLLQWLETDPSRKRWAAKPMIDPIIYSTIYFESNIFSADILRHDLLEEKHTIAIVTEEDETPNEIKYLLKLNSDCYPEEECKFCYFEKNEFASNPDDERYFFPVNNASETPMLIFDHPKYGDREIKVANPLNFDEVFKLDGELSPAYYGHTKFNELSFNYFVFPDRFYKANDTKILKHFKEVLDNKLHSKEQKDKFDNVIFITPRRDISSSFLENFTSQYQDSGLKFSIISYRPFDEYSENFEAFYGKNISNEPESLKTTLIIFYTDVIFDGSEFKELNSILKATQRSFDMCWSIVDRTDNISYPRIINRLPKKENDFSYFFKLNVPVQPKSNFVNPIQKRLDKLRQALSDCHLDALKLRVIKEISECEPKDILFVRSNHNSSVPYFPFFDFLKSPSENVKIFEYYNNIYPKDAGMLLKLQLFHEASKEITASKVPIALKNLIKNVSDSISDNFFEPNAPYKNSNEEKLLVRDNVVKLFSRSPFVSFEVIYKQIFEYCILKLNKIVEKPLDSNIVSFSDYRAFKYFVRRSVELNSNYILSEKFMSFLKNIIFTPVFLARITTFSKNYDALKTVENAESLSIQIKKNEAYVHEQVNGLKYFLLYCYKELLLANPARAIVLEDLINRPQMLPDGFNGIEATLESFAQDQFYALGRVLKSENISILTSFKNWYLSNSTHSKEPIEDNKNYIFSSYLDNAHPTSHEHELLLKLIEKSKHASITEESEEIKNSISWMVAISDHLQKLGSEEEDRVDLDKEIRTILDSLKKVFNYRNEKNEIVTPGYLLLVEYNKIGDQRLFYACSSNPEDYEDLQPSPTSFARNVYDGLLDSKKGNLHTFIPLLRIKELEEEKVTSFTKQFFSSITDEIIDLSDALKADANKYKVVKEAKMLEYFRLANITEWKGKVSNSPRGVLILCSPDEPTVHNFRSFQNTEKLRLLLLIKEELLGYITKLVRTDAFVELLTTKQQTADSHAMKHGLNDYFNMISKYVTRQRRSEMVQIIISAIKGQVLSRFGSSILFPSQNSNKNYLSESIALTSKKFQTRVYKLASDPRIGNESIKILCQTDINAFDNEIEEVIFDVVLTELIINMKRYHNKEIKQSKTIYTIHASKNAWSFTNETYLKTYTPKPYGGLYMIKTILRELNYKPYSIDILDTQPSKFNITINLIKNDTHLSY